MKFNIDIDCSPEEFKELFTPGEKQTEMLTQMMDSINKNNVFADHFGKMQKELADTWDNARDTMFKAWEKNFKK